MRKVGLIEADNRNSAIGHWSGTQQTYEKTGKVPEFNIVRLKDAGRRLLFESINLLPVWYEDICEVMSSREDKDPAKMATFVNELSMGNNISQDTISNDEIDCLANLGLSGRCENGMFIPDRRPVFEQQYDRP